MLRSSLLSIDEALLYTTSQGIVKFNCGTRILRVNHGRDARATWITAGRATSNQCE